ncbi:hypothetical protein M569_00736 [Genlisea aurea]|uniref:Uncharacterized protein n=1 Tax=Genlisea aurea TaxID=192259 RepID=S8D999_9LAMI|nr:hypothetical protein M569_00736 [Genlisea aurea]
MRPKKFKNLTNIERARAERRQRQNKNQRFSILARGGSNSALIRPQLSCAKIIILINVDGAPEFTFSSLIEKGNSVFGKTTPSVEMVVSGTPAEDNLDAQMKLALALAIVESKRLRKLPDSSEDELELLRSSVDFLVDLCEQSSTLKQEKGNFKSMSHQAADFILATLKALPLDRMRSEATESIVGSLIMRLMRSMCNGTQGHEVLPCPNTFQLCVQHLMRNLGSNPVIGQCIILSASHGISMTAESLVSLDPFDCRFSKSHQCLFLMVQLMEFVISDYLLSWPTNTQFDSTRKSLEALENMNTVYALYMDQVVGELTRNLSQPPFLQGMCFITKLSLL